MTAQIIDGKQVAADMRAELKAEVAKLKEKGIVPGLGVILVGDDPASKSYVTAKRLVFIPMITGCPQIHHKRI